MRPFLLSIDSPLPAHMGQGETPILQLCFVDEPHKGDSTSPMTALRLHRLYSLACVNMSKIFFPIRDGGEYRIRTDDPLLAKQVL